MPPHRRVPGPESTAGWSSTRTGTRTGALGGTRTGVTEITRVKGAQRGPLTVLLDLVRHGVLAAWAAVITASRAVREALTPAGGVVLAAAGAGLLLGLLAGSAAGWVLAVVGSVLLVLGCPFLLGGHEYDVALLVASDRAVAGREISGEVRVRNTGRRHAMPATLDVAVAEGIVVAHVPSLAPGATHVEQLRITAHRRGVIDVGPMTLVRSDPVGLLRREVSWDQRQTVYVHPLTVTLTGTSAGALRDLEGTASSRVVSSDLAFHAIREYVPGDPQRNVHWKSTAKMGRLMVREYEETLRSRLAVLLSLDSADYAEDDEVELAVSVAASLGVQGVRQGRDTFAAVSQEVAGVDRAQALSIRALPTAAPRTFLDATSEIQASPRATPLEGLATLAASACPQMSLGFLVTGSGPDLSRLRAAATSLPAGSAVVAVRVELGAEPGMQAFAEVTVLTVGALQDLRHLTARRVQG
ncbi:MAG: DUF58 domain-containing protein [Cellulomonadaceae bacterium]|nr:DUF58 domain-containing protein [Cellulomonadaceae bacterium]